MATIYIYEAMDAESFNALKDYVCDIESAPVLLNKAENTIKVYDNGSDAVSEVGKFIDDNALNFHISNDDIATKTQRIAELEEEVKNLTDDCDRLMKQRNEYAHQVRKTMEELETARRQFKTERDTYTKQLDEFEKLMYILYHAPKNIKNYFAKKGKY